MECAVPNQGNLERIAAEFETAVARATTSFDSLLGLNPKSVVTLRDYAMFMQRVCARVLVPLISRLFHDLARYLRPLPAPACVICAALLRTYACVRGGFRWSTTR